MTAIRCLCRHSAEHVTDRMLVMGFSPRRRRLRSAASREQPHSEQRHAIMEAYPELHESCSLILLKVCALKD